MNRQRGPRLPGIKRLGTDRTPNTPPIELTVAIGTRIHVGITQAQVVAKAAIVRSRRPIVAGGPSIVG